MLTELNSSTDERVYLLNYSLSCPKASDDVQFMLFHFVIAEVDKVAC